MKLVLEVSNSQNVFVHVDKTILNCSALPAPTDSKLISQHS